MTGQLHLTCACGAPFRGEPAATVAMYERTHRCGFYIGPEDRIGAAEWLVVAGTALLMALCVGVAVWALW
jgi:hypothetical protein